MRYRSGGFGPLEGPEDLWQRAAERDREVLAEATFPLYAPVAPALDPRALAEYQITNGRLVKVELSTGDWFSAEGPQVKVTTVSEADPGVSEAWASLADLLAGEWDRLRLAAAMSGGSGTSADSGVIVEGESGFVVEGALVEGTLRREGPLWVARLPLPAAEVLLVVTGRGVAPEGVELGVVTDTAPYALGRQHLLNELTLRRQRQEKRQADSGGAEESAAPLGLDDHRHLIDFCVADALRFEAQVRAHGVPHAPDASGADRRGLWERAVRQQMRLAGEDRQEADESVTAMVTQMVTLAQAVDWFADPAGPAGPESRSAAGAAAVEESIRFTALDSDVRSAPAQRAWLRQWHRLDEPPFPGDPRPTPEERRLRLELTVAARADWLDLWRAWVAAQ